MQPNIIWITIDSLRTDHTTLHGYNRDTTNNIKKFAEKKESVQLKNCFAHGKDTASSTASIFTGTYPSFHQVNIGGSTGTIPKELDTITELLNANGYSTACITRNPRLALVDADRGFDEFREVTFSSLLKPQNMPISLQFMLNLRDESAGFSLEKMNHSLTFVLNKLAERRIDSFTKSNPNFLYLHYNEPHGPFLPPLPFRTHYLDDISVSESEAVETSKDIHDNAIKYMAQGLPLSDEECASLKAMYDSSIAYTDRKVGKLLEYIDSVSDDNTIIVVTADHGELLGEGGLIGHQFLQYDAVSHVPMIVSGIDDIEHKRSELCQHGDVVRTLLEVADVDYDEEQFGGTIDLRSGHREFTVTQSNINFDGIREHNSQFEPPQMHSGLTTAIRTKKFKLFYSERNRNLYKIPNEETNVRDRYPEEFESLQEKYLEWNRKYGTSPYSNDERDNYDKSTKQRLRELGYMPE